MLNIGRHAALIAICLMLSSHALGKPAPDLSNASYDDILSYCQAHPDNRIGGAAIGDCLGEQTEQLEHLLQSRQTELLSTQCPAVILQAMIAQQQWQSYRTSQCGLYRAMFDNTAMYNNSQACRLQLTLDYRQQIDFLARYKPEDPMPCNSSP